MIIEKIFSFEDIIEKKKSIEFNNPMYTAFIDFAKAFESVRLPSLWKYLDETRRNKKYTNLFEN